MKVHASGVYKARTKASDNVGVATGVTSTEKENEGPQMPGGSANVHVASGQSPGELLESTAHSPQKVAAAQSPSLPLPLALCSHPGGAGLGAWSQLFLFLGSTKSHDKWCDLASFPLPDGVAPLCTG